MSQRSTARRRTLSLRSRPTRGRPTFSFLGNALNVTGFGAANPVGIRLSLSQSFGYSVADGGSYGDTRLGYVSLDTTTVPEPSTYALFAAGLAARGVVARRRRKI